TTDIAGLGARGRVGDDVVIWSAVDRERVAAGYAVEIECFNAEVRDHAAKPGYGLVVEIDNDRFEPSRSRQIQNIAGGWLARVDQNRSERKQRIEIEDVVAGNAVQTQVLEVERRDRNPVVERDRRAGNAE